MRKGGRGTIRECELLLFFFTVGAFATTLFGAGLSRWLTAFPGSIRGCMALLVLAASLLQGSLHAFWAEPLITPLAGAAAALEVQRLLDSGVREGFREFWPVLPAVILYFVLCVWGMNLSAECVSSLRARAQGRTGITLSIIMALIGLAAAVLLMRSTLME